MSQNVVKYLDDGRVHPRRVFYTGSGALLQGIGLCYERDFASTDFPAAGVSGQRDKRVELPNFTNTLAFAGVTARGYTAAAAGQWIEIYEPGSVCLIYTTAASTIGEESFAWCQAGYSAAPGQWYPGTLAKGFMGTGCAQILQTPGAAGLTLAYLCVGPPSGLIEVVPAATINGGGDFTFLNTGTTIFLDPALETGDVADTLSAGAFAGQKKMYWLQGAAGTNDVLITLNPTGLLANPATATFAPLALTSLEFDAAGDMALLEFSGTAWVLIMTGPTGAGPAIV